MGKMTTSCDADEVATAIADTLELDDYLGVPVVNTRSFEDEGVLTDDAGFTITLADGSRFQVTVVQSLR